MISGQLLAAFQMDSATGRVVLKMEGHGDLELGERHGLSAAREQVDFILSRFQATLATSTPTLEALTKAIGDLDHDMGQIAFMLAGESTDRLDEIRARFIKAWPQWHHPTDVVPVIEIRGHDQEFPFELLPLFDATPVVDFANYAEAEDAIQRFLGFGVAMRRTIGEEVQAADLEATPQLPLQFLRYEMDGTVTEGSYFGECLNRIALEGPWPKPDIETKDVRERLIDALYDPMKTLTGEMRDGPPVQIQHFACHCETSSGTDTGYALILGGPDAGRRSITLGRIRTGFRVRRQQLGAIADARPLIVANACGSSKIDKETRRSFPRWFLNNRHRGFLGTETDVPDEVAAAFAERLYTSLLNDHPLGEAVVLARRQLMAERCNPLGLLYVLYGDPGLVIANRLRQ
jgi:CHAT domain